MLLYGVSAILGSLVKFIFISRLTKIRVPPLTRVTKIGAPPP